jgi:archaellum biogenesis ATPase FlaH
VVGKNIEALKQLFLTMVETPSNQQFIINVKEYIEWFSVHEQSKINGDEMFVIEKDVKTLWKLLMAGADLILDKDMSDPKEIIISLFHDHDNKLYKELIGRIGKLTPKMKAIIIKATRSCRSAEELRESAKGVWSAIDNYESNTSWLSFSDAKEKMELQVDSALDQINNNRTMGDSRFVIDHEHMAIDKTLDTMKEVDGIRLKTGIATIDEIHGGLVPGNLITGFSTSGGGKSVFSTNLAIGVRNNNNALDEKILIKCKGRKPTIVFFTHENSDTEVLINIMEIYVGGKEIDRIKKLASDDMKREAMKYIAGGPEHFSISVIDVPEGVLSIQGMRSELLAERKKGREPVLVIDDYLELLAQDKASKTPLGDLAQGLKNIAKEFKVPVFTTHQLNNDQLKDMEEFAGSDVIKCFKQKNIANDKSVWRKLDLGIFVYRTTYRGVQYMGVKIGKIRSNCPLTHPNGDMRTCAIPYEDGWLYRTGPKEYASVLDMPGLEHSEMGEAFKEIDMSQVATFDANDPVIKKAEEEKK